MDQHHSYWRRLLGRDVPLAAIAALSLFNGTTFSPLFDPVLFLLRPATRAFFITDPTLLFYLTSLLIALLTLLVAGIPAAVYERVRGLERSTPVSLGIWLATTLLLSLATIMALVGEE